MPTRAKRSRRDRRGILRSRRDQRRQGRGGVRQGARGARAGADAGQLRGRRQRRQDGRPRQGDRASSSSIRCTSSSWRSGSTWSAPSAASPFGVRHGRDRAARRRRARGDHQHRLGRGRGRADRAGGLFGIEGRRAGDGAADRARPDERRRAGQHHPAGRVQDADGGDDAAAMCRTRWRRRCRSPSGSARPRNMRRLAVFIVENVYLNAESIRLDGGIRMAPR